MFKYSIDDVKGFFNGNPDSNTVSSSMVNQMKYFVKINFFDIMAIFSLKYDSNVNPTIGLGSVFL